MEHGQEAGESIGAMLASIATVLREVSDKLDAVAARVDGAPVVVSTDRSVEARLAKLEAWAFGAGQDISGINRRLEKLESGGGSAHAAPEGERAERPPLPRAASRRNAAASEASTSALRESGSGASTPLGRESTGRPSEPAASATTTFESAATARDTAAATRESVSRRYDSTPDAPARDSAAHELNSVPQRTFSAPREPAAYESSNGTNFTAPTPREPSPASSANFTAPTPREPLPVRQSNFTTPREPASTSYQNFTAPPDKPYESMIPAAATNGDYGIGRTNGSAPEENGVALTGAHRAGEEDLIPVDNTHVDKLQAMLDELKKTAAAPLGRSDVFGPPPTDLNSTGYQPERSTDTPRDYRLSGPPSHS
ncbi:hypothetical protein [Nocardia sp. NPDC049149]|uniref:hypothetical protein n=1 Tax=Nocardia sp. NPDC049149 TaxID=3364315 RepID=UPI00371D1A88